MGLPFYLAMTAGEIHCAEVLPERLAYMACHFSPYSTGLSNLPQDLPEGSLLMINDRIPIFGHDPERIRAQLRKLVDEFHCGGIVLDFQREGYEEQQVLCHHLSESLSCPVAVSEKYAGDLSCPVFLSAPAINAPLPEYLSAYKSREVWLEAAPDARCFTVTEHGCTVTPLLEPVPPDCDVEKALHCRYTWTTDKEAVRFHLWRTADDLSQLLLEAESLGVPRVIGLYQEMYSMGLT